MNLTDLENALETILLQHHNGSDGSHDIHHARRVLLNAKEIARRESVDVDLPHLAAAAYLHDLVNVSKDSAQRSQASRLSADAAGPILAELGFPSEEIGAIQHSIAAHSFSANLRPETIEAKILQDADRIESVGALGIARTFYTAGKLASLLFDGEDPFAERRELDDKRFAADHFKAKLIGLCATMQTESGKAVAEERTAFMHRFLDQLGKEIGVENAWIPDGRL